MRRLLLLRLVVILVLGVPSPAGAGGTLRVYYAGPPKSSVRLALDLSGLSESFFLVTDPLQADVFLLEDAIPDAAVIHSRLEAGAGLVLFLGPDIQSTDLETLLGIPLTLTEKRDAVSPTDASSVPDPATREIVWNSAPQVRDRFTVTTSSPDIRPLVTAYEDGSWILWSTQNGRAFIFNAFLGGSQNPQFQEWAYYNYLIYQLAVRAGGQTALSFADYPGSPVPHPAQRNLLIAILAGLLVTTFGVFFLVRRYSLNHPEELDRIVSDRSSFEAREAQTEWEQVGFHRPLGGFLVALSIGLVLFIPLIIYQNLILPSYILPSAQALGIWLRVTQFFNLAWLFFDMGTSIAFIKYLSEHRVRDPRKGIQFGQVFVWWQVLSGAIQVAIVVGLASTLAPRSAYALYAWSVIVHSFIQLPGFYQVARHALTGFQRLDYSRLLDIFLNLVLPMIVQPIFVSAMFLWGKSHPVFGPAMGGLLGLGIAAYAAEAATFAIGLGLYRRVGYNARVLSWLISTGRW